jgi:hypothetical protein
LFLYSDMGFYMKKAIVARIKRYNNKYIKIINRIRIIICIPFMDKYKSIDILSIITI